MKAADLAIASTDSTAMFNYGYQNFTKLQVNGGEVLVPNGVTVDNLTVREEPSDGEIIDNYYYGDYMVGSVTVPEATPTPEPAADIVSENGTADSSDAGQSVGTDTSENTDEEVQESSQNSKSSAGIPQLRKILLGIGAAMILILIILLIALSKKEKKYYR